MTALCNTRRDEHTRRHTHIHTYTHIHTHRMSHRLFACVQTCSLNSPGLIYLMPPVSCFMSCCTGDPRSTTTNRHTQNTAEHTHPSSFVVRVELKASALDVCYSVRSEDCQIPPGQPAFKPLNNFIVVFSIVSIFKIQGPQSLPIKDHTDALKYSPW